MAAKNPNVLLPTGFGINCEAETAQAFASLGATVHALHLNEILARPEILGQMQILVLAGGFSFGDHLGSGRVLANRLRRIGDDLERLIARGGLVLGICNGFQTMARLGLVPRGQPGSQQVSLAENHQGAFYDGWVTLRIDPASPCIFTRGLHTLELPVRHGEGRLVVPPALATEIERDHLVPLHYVQPATLQPAEAFPENPNGSAGGMAGLCDKTGRIFGLMPHPEAFLYRENHPRWRREPIDMKQSGRALFENALHYCRTHL